MKKLSSGTILQVVLILFIVLSSYISQYSMDAIYLVKQYELALQYDQIRLFELSIIEYYVETLKEGFLPSNQIIFDDYVIEYVVNDNTKEYVIMTTLEKEDVYTRAFEVKIDCNTKEITSFELD